MNFGALNMQPQGQPFNPTPVPQPTPPQILPSMNKLTPNLTEDQLKQNIDALQRQKVPNDKIQAYVDNYGKGSDGYTLKTTQQQTPSAPPQDNNTGLMPFLTTSQGQLGPIAPAAPNDSPLLAGAKTAANALPDTANLGKGILSFLNPVNAANSVKGLATGLQQNYDSAGDTSQYTPSPSDVLKEIPGNAYKMLVPQGIRQAISGDFSGAAQSVENNPMQTIGPAILGARGLLGDSALGAAVDNAVPKIASPITKPASYVTGKVGGGAGAVASQTLGAATGAGASSVAEAARSGYQTGSKPGLNYSDAFTQALHGKVSPEQVVQTVTDAIQNIRDTRGSAYQAQLAKLGENTSSHDISPVLDSLQTQLQKFNVRIDDKGQLDFSRSAIANNGTARADIQGVYDTVKDWGSQQGDRTGVGLDTLKKQLGDFYSDSGQARAFVQGVKGSVSNILGNIPGYSDMTGGYAKASQLLDEIKSATGIGGSSKPDTVFTKLTTAMKGDKELRLQVLKEIESKTGNKDIMSQIAGTNMQSYIPKGLVGKGMDVSAALGLLAHSFSPEIIPALLTTSPRIVGEFVHALGLGVGKTAEIIRAINQTVTQTAQSPILGKGRQIQSSAEPNTISNALKGKQIGLSMKAVNPFDDFTPHQQALFQRTVDKMPNLPVKDWEMVKAALESKGYQTPTTQLKTKTMLQDMFKSTNQRHATLEQATFDNALNRRVQATDQSGGRNQPMKPLLNKPTTVQPRHPQTQQWMRKK